MRACLLPLVWECCVLRHALHKTQFLLSVTLAPLSHSISACLGRFGWACWSGRWHFCLTWWDNFILKRKLHHSEQQEGWGPFAGCYSSADQHRCVVKCVWIQKYQFRQSLVLNWNPPWKWDSNRTIITSVKHSLHTSDKQWQMLPSQFSL